MHVGADPEALRERLKRRDRHGVHYDREAADEIAERARAGEWAPIPVGGELIEIDTTVDFPTGQAVAERLS